MHAAPVVPAALVARRPSGQYDRLQDT